MQTISVVVDLDNARGRTLVAPAGTRNPHHTLLSAEFEDVPITLVQEKETGQCVLTVRPEAYGDRSTVTLRYRVSDGGSSYPEDIFKPRLNRYTRAAEALVSDVAVLTRDCQDQRDIVETLVAHTAQTFSYGHPETRYYDGYDHVPLLGCGLTEGSCVDINMYLIAALRSAGIEAGYMVGYFFPQEKNGRCRDAHCWVLTRVDGQVQEWDTAHHLKLGTRDVRPGLNPKPGQRVALSHSMGWDLPALAVNGLKLLGEPMWVDDYGVVSSANLSICTDTMQQVAA